MPLCVARIVSSASVTRFASASRALPSWRSFSCDVAISCFNSSTLVSLSANFVLSSSTSLISLTSLTSLTPLISLASLSSLSSLISFGGVAVVNVDELLTERAVDATEGFEGAPDELARAERRFLASETVPLTPLRDGLEICVDLTVPLLL